jgi:CRISPR-associated protein Csm1
LLPEQEDFDAYVEITVEKIKHPAAERPDSRILRDVMDKREELVLKAMLSGVNDFLHLAEPKSSLQEKNIFRKQIASFTKEQSSGEDKELAGLIAEAKALALASVVQGAGVSFAEKRLEIVTQNITFIQQESPQVPEKNRKTSYYPIIPLSLLDETFPVEGSDSISPEALAENYAKLWKKFAAECGSFPDGSFEAFLFSLTHLLHKYTWCIPGRLENNFFNVSLFDLTRVSTALAVCLHDARLDKTEKEFLFIECDIAGIQDFIYNPAFNGQELQDGLARRLRGRSFYINLLVKTLADYVRETLNLYCINILWATGGRLLLVAPNTEFTRKSLTAARLKIEKYIWREFRGALNVLITDCACTVAELKDFGKVRERLANELTRRKQQQFHTLLNFNEGDLETPWQSAWVINTQDDICRDTGRDMKEAELKISKVIQVTEDNPEPPPRSLHSLLFDRIGRALIEAQTFQLSKQPAWLSHDDKVFHLPLSEADAKQVKHSYKKVLVEFSDFNRTWLLTNDLVPQAGASWCLRIADHRNQQIAFMPASIDSNIAYGFEFLADAVRTEWNKEKGRREISDFHTLAENAEGVNFLGALRMDVDNLGYVFAGGLMKEEGSLAKIANLSRMIDYFFAGYLNTLTIGKTPEEKNLYTTYAGGDDLVIIGAWNEILEVATTIQNDFKRFCGFNRNVNISAGIYLCKGKFPIGRAIEYAGEKLNSIAKSKKQAWLGDDTDKNALAFLENKINWTKWRKAQDFSLTLIKEIDGEERKVSRKLIYHLLALYRQHIHPQRKASVKFTGQDIVWVGKLKYSVVRNVKDAKLRAQIIDEIPKYQNYIPILAGYVSLKTRKKD